MTQWRSLVLLILSGVFVAVPASAEPARRLNLAECVDLALQKNRALERASARFDGAEAARLSMRGRFGPVGRVEANLIYWDKESMVSMAPPGVPAEPLLVRGQTTSQIIGSVIQPLTGLSVISDLYSATARGVDAARYDHLAAQNDVVLAVASAYFDALKAEQFVRISELSVKQIEAHRSEAASFHRKLPSASENALRTSSRIALCPAQNSMLRSPLTRALRPPSRWQRFR